MDTEAEIKKIWTEIKDIRIYHGIGLVFAMLFVAVGLFIEAADYPKIVLRVLGGIYLAATCGSAVYVYLRSRSK